MSIKGMIKNLNERIKLKERWIKEEKKEVEEMQSTIIELKKAKNGYKGTTQ